ncbi:UPF0146 family protein [Halobellus sp. H-GB7]|uniref:UPF0146 family protein n=1 Tax=Halobellus sp. H-GB7 TaxID=3069756 RepID=UPI0027B5B98B|nr:UPF0146 family protein [Halobellus sp. H-GB7]MDQ2055797.1 UPF0146 family protein [Halobellus sp. H-GB7]
METPRNAALVARFSPYGSATEIGVGRRPEVAAALADAGVSVTATDITDVDVPASVEFVRDDVVDASERDEPGEHYQVDLLYGLNLPPELHRPTWDVARAVGADFLFTTLGFDEPTVPCDTESLAGGETLYVPRERS